MLSAAVLGPAVLLVNWYGHWPFDALMWAGLAGITWEWGTMCRWRPLPLVAGVAYAAVAVASFWAMRQFSWHFSLYILVVVWCSDVGAYVAGRLLGGPRLAPAISPGKTWSGAAGGLLAATVGGVVTLGDGMKLLPLAMVMGIACQLGDLGESALKRHYKVKDSSGLIPGHGGLLDRLDGLMAASIVMAGSLWLQSLGYEVYG